MSACALWSSHNPILWASGSSAVLKLTGRGAVAESVVTDHSQWCVTSHDTSEESPAPSGRGGRQLATMRLRTAPMPSSRATIATRSNSDPVAQRSALRNTRREMPSCFRSVGCLSGNKLFDRGPDGFVCWCGSLVEAQHRDLMLDRGKRDQGVVGRTAEDLPGGYGGQKLQVAGF